MAVTFVNVGTVAGGTSGNATPGMPSSWAVDDIFILLCVSRDNVSHSCSAGWTQWTQQNNTANERISVWWRRAQSGDTAPTITHTAGSAIAAQIAAFRGVIGRGTGQTNSPFDSGSSTTLVSTTSGTNTITGITTATNNAMVVALWGHGHATNSNEARAYSSGGVTTTTTTIGRTGSSTNRACVQFARGVLATAGATGNQVFSVTTVTPSATYPGSSFLLALAAEVTKTATANAVIQDTVTKTATADAVVQGTVTKTATADAVISDGSSPGTAVIYGTTTWGLQAQYVTTSAQSGAFDAPAGSLIVVAANIAYDTINNTTGAISISDNKSLSWTNQLNLQAANNYGHISIWTAPVASAQTGVQVTVSGLSGSDTHGMACAAWVITDYDTSDPIGGLASDDHGSGSAAIAQTITAEQAGSIILGTMQGGSSTSDPSLRSDTTKDGISYTTGTYCNLSSVHLTDPTTGAGSYTVGYTTSDTYNLTAAIEIRAAPGGSSPTSKTATADAVVQAAQTKTATAGAVVQAGQSKTATSDAVIKAAATPKTATADASILLRPTPSAVADGVVALRSAPTASAGAVIQAGQTGTAQAGAVIADRVAKTATVNAVVLAVQTANAFADAVVIEPSNVSKSATADAVIRGTLEKTAQVTAVVQDSRSATAAATAVVQASQSQTAQSTAVVAAIQSKNSAADAVVLAQQSKASSADAVVQAGQTKSASADAVIDSGTQTKSLSASADAVLALRSTPTAFAGAVVQAGFSATALVEAVIRASQSSTASAGAVVALRSTPAATAGAVVLAQQSATASAGAVVQAAFAPTAQADAVIVSQSYTKTAVADGIIAEGWYATAQATAVVRGTIPATAQADAIITGSVTKSASADAIVSLPTAALAASADAVVAATSAPTAQVDAVIAGVFPRTSLADAVVRAGFTGSALADAVVLARQTKTASVDGIVAVPHRLDAYATAVIEYPPNPPLDWNLTPCVTVIQGYSVAGSSMTRIGRAYADAKINYEPKPTAYADAVITDTSLTFLVDPSLSASYPGTGTTITNLGTAGGTMTLPSSAMYQTSPQRFTFSGTQYIDTGKAPSALGMYDHDYTVRMVFKFPSTSGDYFAVGTSASGTRVSIHVGQRSGTLYFAHYAADVTGGAVSANTWYICHYVYNKAANTGAIYRNGTLVCGPSAMNSLLQTTNLWLGRCFSSYFTGEVGHWAIYNRVLGQSEITADFNNMRGRFGI